METDSHEQKYFRYLWLIVGSIFAVVGCAEVLIGGSRFFGFGLAFLGMLLFVPAAFLSDLKLDNVRKAIRKATWWLN
jgi:hypothetical protein